MPGVVSRFFRTGPDLPERTDADVPRIYEKRRWSVFLSVTLGYATFYVCRINFSVAKKSMLDDGVLDASQMGLIGSALLLTYGVGRLANGFLSDHMNIRRFISTALLASAFFNLFFGLSSLFPVFVALWAVNGWVQSAGSSPCVVALSSWFTFRERGTRYGIWSMSHTIGEAVTFAVTGSLVAWLGWRSGFLGPALLGGTVALILFRTLADRPQTYGLPPVWKYKGEPEPPTTDHVPVAKLQAEVLRNPGVWVLGLASALMYVARYGMDHWGPLFLQVTKGYTQGNAGLIMAVTPIAGMCGTALSGVVSDRVFGSRRQETILGCAVLEIGALCLLAFSPAGCMWLDAAGLVIFGLGIGGLTSLVGGLMAVDLVSRRAAGAAMGLVGVFSYIGAAVQDTVSGYLVDGCKVVVDHAPSLPPGVSDALVAAAQKLGLIPGALPAGWSDALSDALQRLGVVHGQYSLPPGAFDGVFRFWTVASIASMLLALSLWRVKPRA